MLPPEEQDSEETMVVLHQARTPVEAEILAALLRGQGIAVLIQGGQLNDQFAVSQRFMNLQGVKLLVHPDRLEEAQKILAERGDVDQQELERQAMNEEPESEEG